MTTPSGITPDGSSPDNLPFISGMSWGEMQDTTQSDWESEINNQWEGSFDVTKLFGSFIQDLPLTVLVMGLQLLAGLLDGVPIVGGILSDIVQGIADSINGTRSTANNAQSSTDAQASVGTTPLWTGLDKTAEVSVPYSTTLTGFNVTQANARGGFIRLKGGDEKRVITWMGSGNASITHAYIDLFLMDLATGNVTRVHQSPDLAGILLGSVGWHQYSIATGTDGFLATKDDILLVRFRVVGAGTHVIYGKTITAATPLSGTYPTKMGVVHDGTSSTTSATSITQASLGATDDVPFFELATDHGQDDLLKSFFDDFARANGNLGTNWSTKSTWANQLQINAQVVRYNGSTDGTQAGTWLYPLTTDRMYNEANVHSLGGGSAYSGAFICADNQLTNMCAVRWNSSGIKISTGSYSSWTDQASLSVTVAAEDNISIEYDDVNNKFIVSRNGTHDVLHWTDSTNIVTHGSTKRFGGIFCSRTPFNTSGEIGLFTFKDMP